MFLGLRPFAELIGRRKYTLVYRSSFLDEAGPFKLRLWNELNDFTHVYAPSPIEKIHPHSMMFIML